MKFLREHHYEIFVLALALIFFGIALYTTYPIGAGVSGDAVKNLAVADNLANGKGFVEYSSNPLLSWPPLYPLLLMGLKIITKQDVFLIGWYLNIMLLSINIWLAGKWFKIVLGENILLSYLATSTVGLSLSLFRISINIASDPLFYTLIIIFFLFIGAYIKTDEKKYFWLAILVTALASTQRYVGLILIPIFAMIEFFKEKKNPIKMTMSIALFSGVSILPLAAWIYFHNYLIYHSLTGPRSLSEIFPYENFLDTSRKIINWYIPYGSLEQKMGAGLSISIVTLIGIALFSWLAFINRGDNLQIFKKELLTPYAGPGLLFFVVYEVFLMFSVNTDAHLSLFSDRFQVAGLFSFSIFIGLVIGDLVIPKIKLEKRWINAIIIASFVIWTARPAYNFYKYVVSTKAQGDTTYNVNNLPQIANSTGVEYARELISEDPEVSIYSNFGGALWFFIRRPILPLPRYDKTVIIDVLKNNNASYIIWFIPNPNPFVLTPEELSQYIDLEPIYSRDDGIVYRVPPSSQ
jgi:hypothetical protein